MKLHVRLSILILICINFSCAITKHSDTSSINHLKFLAEYDIPYNKNFKNTIIGGLSGIDYNATSNIYYMISDDRSDKNPARFYEAEIIINKNKIDSVAFTDVKFLKNNSGNNYPNSNSDPYHTLTLKHCVTTLKTKHLYGAVKASAL